ncbi:MAG: glycosyltransferase family 4 protein, partial [Pseudobdellovibrionaceae bacterium]
ATSFHPDRQSENFEFDVHQFKIYGNSVRGITGEVSKYIEFLKSEKFDLVYVKAAQQWSFDLILDNIEQIPSKIAVLTCGLPNLDDPTYSGYYAKLKEKLPQFAGFFFNSKTARDYNWIKSQGYQNLYTIHNGASESEFLETKSGFRKKFGISESDCILLSIGNPRVQKGQFDLIQVFQKIKVEKPTTLVLVGDEINPFRVFLEKIYRRLRSLPPDPEHRLYDLSKSSELNSGFKRILCVNLPRKTVLEAYFDSQAMIFLSKIEYAPLVLFEAMASGLPFFSTNVGNSKEIAALAQSGIILNSKTGDSRLDETDLEEIARYLEKKLSNEADLKVMGEMGRQFWKRHLTWTAIADHYAAAFAELIKKSS